MLRRAAAAAGPRLLRGGAAGGTVESSLVAATAASTSSGLSFPSLGAGGPAGGFGELPFAAQGMGGQRHFSSSPASAAPETADVEGGASLAGALADASANSLSIAAELGEKAALAQAMEGCWIPTQGMIEALNQLHLLSGMPWYATIPIATLLVRGVTLPLMASQVTNAYKMAKAKPELERLVAEMKAKGGENPDEKTALEYQEKVSAVWAKYGANPFSAFRPLLINAPIFMSFFFALRQLSDVHLPSLATEGFGWVTDLTVADSTMILPLLTPMTLLLTVELNAMDGMAAGSPQSTMMKWFMRGVSVLMMPVMFTMPSCVLLYWSTTNAFSLGWSQAIKFEGVRSAFGMPSREQMAALAGKEPPVDYMAKAKEAYANITGKKMETDVPGSNKISEADFVGKAVVGKPTKSRAVRRRKKN